MERRIPYSNDKYNGKQHTQQSSPPHALLPSRTGGLVSAMRMAEWMKISYHHSWIIWWTTENSTGFAATRQECTRAEARQQGETGAPCRLPGGPAGGTPHSQGRGSVPGWGTKTWHAAKLKRRCFKSQGCLKEKTKAAHFYCTSLISHGNVLNVTYNRMNIVALKNLI